jgi:hypothetical protein
MIIVSLNHQSRFFVRLRNVWMFYLINKRELKIRTFLSTSEIVIISKTCRFNKSLISLRLDSANVNIEMRTKMSDESSSSCKNTVISARFWYLSNRRFARMNLVWISDAKFWFSSSDDDSVDWTFSLIDWIDSTRYSFITVLRKSIDSDDNSILQISSSMFRNLNDSVHLSRWLLLSRHTSTFELRDKSWIEITMNSFRMFRTSATWRSILNFLTSVMTFSIVIAR